MSKVRRAYVLAGRIAGPFALVGLKAYTLLTNRPRVRVIVVNEHGEILLVKGVISHLGRWTLPGGGVNRDEKLDIAASREIHEETGIERPASDYEYLRTIEKTESHLMFDAPIFILTVKKSDLPKQLVNPAEIAEIGWFDPTKLPDNAAKLVTMAVDEWRGVTSVRRDH